MEALSTALVSTSFGSRQPGPRARWNPTHAHMLEMPCRHVFRPWTFCDDGFGSSFPLHAPAQRYRGRAAEHARLPAALNLVARGASLGLGRSVPTHRDSVKTRSTVGTRSNPSFWACVRNCGCSTRLDIAAKRLGSPCHLGSVFAVGGGIQAWGGQAHPKINPWPHGPNLTTTPTVWKKAGANRARSETQEVSKSARVRLFNSFAGLTLSSGVASQCHQRLVLARRCFLDGCRLKSRPDAAWRALGLLRAPERARCLAPQAFSTTAHMDASYHTLSG